MQFKHINQHPASIERITRLSCRNERQALYLACFMHLTPWESRRFFKVYNNAALRRAVQETNTIQPDSNTLVDHLLLHFTQLFTGWASARQSGHLTELSRYFDLLEDLNIAAIAYRHKVCLPHARDMNRRMKQKQQELYQASPN